MTTLLEVKNLKKYFTVRDGYLRAVDDISFSLEKGETLGLVGESGCGKSTLGRTILRLTAPTAGSIKLDDWDITQLSRKELLSFRRRMQIVFQDPYSSLNPRLTVEKTLMEPLRVHGLASSDRDIRERVAVRRRTLPRPSPPLSA